MIGEQLKHFVRVISPKAGFEFTERVAVPGNRRFRRFLIVTPGRAGSQMLVQRCNSHEQVICYGELFATGAPDQAPVTIDVETLERALKLLEVAQHNITQILDGSVCLPLLYEDLVAYPERSNRIICEFLGVKDQRLTHTSRKQARGSLAERVTNFEQLREHFQKTRWEHCLTDA
jgi:hypothetical protein